MKKETAQGWLKDEGMDSLFNQMSNISKAHGYDILAQQVKELKQVIRELIAFGELEELEFTEEHTTKAFQQLVAKAKLLSYDSNA